MRLIDKTAILVMLVTAFAGCRSIEAPAWYKDAWRGFPYQDAKEKLGYYRNVMLVCISEDHGEQVEVKDFAGNMKDGGYDHHYKATIVKSYKGDRKVSDRIAFAQGYCPCGGKRESTTNSFVGTLKFLLVEKGIQTNEEFWIDPSDTERYEPETDRLFTYILERNGAK